MRIEKNKIIPYKNLTCNDWNEYSHYKDLENTILIINFPIIRNSNPIIGRYEDFNFKNCVFEYEIKIININDPSLTISFLNCKFKKPVNIDNNNIKEINLIWHYSDSEKDSPLNSFFESEMSISSNKFELFCKIKGLNQTQSGSFSFVGNIFNSQPREINPKRETQYEVCNIENCNLFNGSFNNNTFYMPFSFKHNILKYNSEYSGHSFINNLFQKSYFSYTDFGNKAKFNRCDFLGTTLFDHVKSSNQEFDSCKFNGYTHFNNAKISNLSILYSSFNRPTSFNEAEFDILKLFEAKFINGVYFDEMKINKVLDRSYLKDKSKISDWKKTLRTIKQESQKLENKIDFNNYRNYELAAHYEELNIGTNFKDTSILWATKWSSNFGNWFWALGFTVVSGLFWFSILYRIENSGTFNFEKINEYFVGAFRFFLVTDFFNPLENDRTYLDNGWSWLIFIFGKIFIAFGIYEMIQSFRKFKA
ncbi:hypothetical protein [Flavobacterium sp.]|uniref:hypothetical protein n=1 Tax=Flavobacterium sp. TaxID=239 RepID=UPI0025C164CC|nr:hypothetical protein [Flavobacterium sp.]